MYEEMYWANEDTRKFMSRGYLKKDQTVEDRIDQIAKSAEEILKIEGFAEKFRTYLRRGWYSLATPVWSNFGLDRGSPISCFSSYISDSIESFLLKSAEVGFMSKIGGGTSGYFGDIRPRGSSISNEQGKAEGPIAAMRLFDCITSVISQGGSRRGSFAAYLPIDHPDIEEFLMIKGEGNIIQEMSIGVCISDEWMESMLAGDKEKRRIWGKVIEKRFASGYPYIFFSDTVNNAAPQVYKDKELKIHGSNLCVAPETKVLIESIEGSPASLKYYQVKDLVGKKSRVWNGTRFSEVEFFKTSDAEKLLKVKIRIRCGLLHIDEIKELDCTEYHKFYEHGGKEVRAKDLEVGQNLEWYASPLGSCLVTQEVVSVEDLGRVSEVYCAKESRGRILFNDILTGNCSEIALSTSPEESFVCDLSSMNLLHYDDWKDTDAVETLIYFLDAVMTEFIQKTENMVLMKAANTFARKQRALGLGILGWHSLLQSKMIPFESMSAKYLNVEIWKLLKEKTTKATKELAVLFGEPELLKGYSVRNVTTMAIAPTVSSSFILGQVSSQAEPEDSNYFVANLAKGKFPYKNPFLKKLLIDINQDTEEVWMSILKRDGSVQHLDFLTREQKDVFKTFGEISQKEIVIQASQRQKYLDQSQSLNMKVAKGTKPKEVSDLLIFGWEQGIKTFYYQKNFNSAQELARSINNCVSCEG